MKKWFLIFAVALMAMTFEGCVSTQMSVMNATPQIQLKPEHLEVTQQLEASAATTRIFGIDWDRLFNKREAVIKGSVYSSLTLMDHTELYAVYSLLKQHEGYDIVLYPQFVKVVRKPVLGIGCLCTITEVKVKARMAKLKL